MNRPACAYGTPYSGRPLAGPADAVAVVGAVNTVDQVTDAAGNNH